MNKFNISQSEYIRIKNKVSPFIKDVAVYFNTKMENLRYYHFVVYCRDFLGVNFILGGSDYSLLDGFTLKENGNIGVFINNEKPISRIKFTYSHEIIHAVFHDSKTTFASSGGNYTPESMIEEREADIGASLLMANDNAIEEFIEGNLTFFQMCKKFGMSKNALQTRLINYVQYNHEKDNQTAYQIVYAFRGGNNRKLLESYDEYKYSIGEKYYYNPYDDYNPSDDYSFY